jgi:hypothetical protein
MKKITLVVLAATFLLAAACAVETGYRGEAVIVPALPSIVVLEDEPYYYQGGYYYYYHGDHWSYSRSRGGPWSDLPRDRYPKEVRHKHRGDDGGRGDWRERGERHEHERYEHERHEQERHDGY